MITITTYRKHKMIAQAKKFMYVICLFVFVYLASIAVASSTQNAIYSQEIPRGMVCIHDTVPEMYMCSPDQTVPWYLSSTGVLKHVK